MLAALLVLTACGGDEEQGVNLQTAGDSAPPTAPPTSEADAGSEIPAEFADLPGRLLYRQNRTVEILDFAAGEITTVDHVDTTAGGDTFDVGGNIAFTPDFHYGAFVTFPNFGIINLVDNEVSMIANNGSIPSGLGISPDGQWLAVQTGGIVTRLQLVSTASEARFDIGASSQYGFIWTFTPASEFLWTTTEADAVPQRFDYTTGESVPLDDLASYEVLTYPVLAVSPDGTRLARVPRAPGLANVGDNPDACFDSFVEIADLPLTADDPFRVGETVYGEDRLVATSPQWLDDNRLLFVKFGEGSCGDVQGEPLRQIMLLDLSADRLAPVPLAGPIGNDDDPNDFAQNTALLVWHLYSPSPDGRYIAWITGSIAADETIINITEVATGDTRTLRRVTKEEIGDATAFIERALFRQVLWLDG